MVRKKTSVGSCSRKRTSEDPASSSNEPKKRRLIREKTDNYEQELTEKDTHCWICHSNQSSDDLWYFWPCCPRIYHYNCLDDYSTPESETTCPECLLECVDGTALSKPVPLVKLNELIMSVIQKYLNDGKKGRKSSKKKANSKKFELLQIFIQWPSNAESDLIKVVDFTYLINKIRNYDYSKASEFFSDVKWIHHNCHLLYGSLSTVTKEAGKLVQLIKADLLDIEACYECCYPGSKEQDFFMKICNPPHQIIWAQIGKWPFWAAKCLKLNHDSVYVKFFGTHQIGKLSVSKCYYISRNHPKYPCPKTKSYIDSMVELKEYIMLFELQRRELFKYYKPKIVFKPENAGRENQEIHQNLMYETTVLQGESSVVSSNNHSADDLRLGADFSNLNNPAPEMFNDQISSGDGSVIADVTPNTPSSPLAHLNRPGPSFTDPNDSRNHSQVEDAACSGTAVQGRSSHPVVSDTASLNDINTLSRFFSTPKAPVKFTPETFKVLVLFTKQLMHAILNCKGQSSASHRMSPIQQIEEIRQQYLKEQKKAVEKSQMLEKRIRTDYEPAVARYKDKAENAEMLLKNMTISFNNKAAQKDDTHQKELSEKDALLKRCQEKLRALEAENSELKVENNMLKGQLENTHPEAKRNLYCYICLKSAKVLCCIHACYCSDTCQKTDEKRHKIICLKNRASVSQEKYQTTEVEIICRQMTKVQSSSSVPLKKRGRMKRGF